MSILGSIAGAAIGAIGNFLTSKASASAASNLNSKNRAFNAQQAEIQRRWEEEQAQKTMQFNAEQSELAFNRELMASNTAHQREVVDLRAAGLNPILSANSGASAGLNAPVASAGSTPSGAAADSQGASSLGQFFDLAPFISSAMNYDIQSRQLEIAQQNADTERERVINDKLKIDSDIKLNEATISKISADAENVKANTKLIGEQVLNVIQERANGIEYTKAQVAQCYAAAYHFSEMVKVQHQLADADERFKNSATDVNKKEVEFLSKKASKLRDEYEAEYLDTPFGKVIHQMGFGLKELNPFQGSRIGNLQMRGN